MAETNNPPRLSSESWIDDISSSNHELALLVSTINGILGEEILAMDPGEVEEGEHLRLFSIEPPTYIKPQSPREAYHAIMSGRFANFFDDSIFVPDFTRERQCRLKFDFLMSPVSDVLTTQDLSTARQFLNSE